MSRLFFLLCWAFTWELMAQKAIVPDENERLLKSLAEAASDNPSAALAKLNIMVPHTLKERELSAYAYGEAYFYLRHYEKALEWYDSCIVIAQMLSDHTMIADCNSGKGYIHLDFGKYEQALREYKFALDFYKSQGSKRDISMAYHNVASALDYLEQDSAAVYYFRQSLSIDSSLRDYPGIAQTLNNIGWVYLDNGQFERAFESFVRALEIYNQHGTTYQRANVLKNISRIYLTWDDLPDALSYLHEALRIVDTTAHKFYAASIWLTMGEALQMSGDLDGAGQLYQKSLTIFDSLGYTSGLFRARHNYGKLNIQKQDYAAAKSFLLQAGAEAHRMRSPRLKAENYLQLGIVARETFTDSALFFLGKVKKILSRVSMPELEESLYLELAKTFNTLGVSDSALRYFQRYNQYRDSLYALSRFRAIGEIQAKYKFSQLEEVLKNTQAELAGARRRSRVQWWIIASLCGGALLAGWVALLVSRLNRRLQSQNLMLRDKNRQINQQKKDLEEAKAKAEQSDMLKSAFLANMSHEIRTPINGIAGFSRLLVTRNLTPEKQKSYAEVIVNNSNLLLRLINDIIDISKIEANLIEYEPSTFPVNLFLKELEVQFGHELERRKKSVKLRLAIPDSRKSKITLDKERLGQIFRNLIDNSIKFTDEGEIVFGYSIENETIDFFVRDTGIGIPAEMHIAVFERFRQVETGTTRRYSGSGLGLAISKGIVEAMGGRIWLHSELGKGAGFYFSFPLNKVLQDGEQKTDYKVDKIEKMYNWEKKTILIVEDEEINFYYIRETLNETKANILHAKHGQSAVEACKEHPEIDLVLMDIKMPIMNGYDATSEIKAFRPELPIVAQTAYALQGERKLSMQAGCDDYLPKPIRPDVLLSTIAKYLNN